VEINLYNHTSEFVVLFSVHPMIKKEREEGVVPPGVSMTFYVPGMPGTELRIKDYNTKATLHTYVATAYRGSHESQPAVSRPAKFGRAIEVAAGVGNQPPHNPHKRMQGNPAGKGISPVDATGARSRPQSRLARPRRRRPPPKVPTRAQEKQMPAPMRPGVSHKQWQA
jgi:hypothetical protein